MFDEIINDRCFLAFLFSYDIEVFFHPTLYIQAKNFMYLWPVYELANIYHMKTINDLFRRKNLPKRFHQYFSVVCTLTCNLSITPQLVQHTCNMYETDTFLLYSCFVAVIATAHVRCVWCIDSFSSRLLNGIGVILDDMSEITGTKVKTADPKRNITKVQYILCCM